MFGDYTQLNFKFLYFSLSFFYMCIITGIKRTAGLMWDGYCIIECLNWYILSVYLSILFCSCISIRIKRTTGPIGVQFVMSSWDWCGMVIT